MTHHHKQVAARPVRLSVAESGYLQDLKDGGKGAAIPSSARLRFIAYGCIEPMLCGLGITARGRTALLTGRF